MPTKQAVSATGRFPLDGRRYSIWKQPRKNRLGFEGVIDFEVNHPALRTEQQSDSGFRQTSKARFELVTRREFQTPATINRSFHAWSDQNRP